MHPIWVGPWTVPMEHGHDRVAVGFHQDGKTAKTVVDAIGKGGGQARAVEHDMADGASAAPAIDSILARWARLVLVTRAWKSGDWPNPEREDIAIASVEDWRVQLEGNVEGTAQVVRSVLPAMKRVAGAASC